VILRVAAIGLALPGTGQAAEPVRRLHPCCAAAATCTTKQVQTCTVHCALSSLHALHPLLTPATLPYLAPLVMVVCKWTS
jgi:hypothetical protein